MIILWLNELNKHLKLHFPQLDTKFTTEQQRLAKIGTIL